MVRVVPLTDLDNIIRRYHAGETQSEIAATYGVRQASISTIIRNAGAQISRGEAMRRRLARMTPAERSELASAAHDAVRGMVRTSEDLSKRAVGKQRNLSHATDEEIALADELRRVGLAVNPQQAVGKYNVDIGAFPVAVEVFGGGWHAHGRHLARLPERVKYIADSSWNLLIVWVRGGTRIDIPAVAQDALAYHERSSSDPTFRRQYRVIRGTGKFYSAGCVDDDKLALIPTTISRTYS